MCLFKQIFFTVLCTAKSLDDKNVKGSINDFLSLALTSNNLTEQNPFHFLDWLRNKHAKFITFFSLSPVRCKFFLHLTIMFNIFFIAQNNHRNLQKKLKTRNCTQMLKDFYFFSIFNIFFDVILYKIHPVESVSTIDAVNQYKSLKTKSVQSMDNKQSRQWQILLNDKRTSAAAR